MFTPRRIGALSEWISLEVDRILDDLEVRWEETGEPIDIATELAFPLPFKVISDILGMPETDDDQVREWAQAITEASLAMTADGIAAATTAYHALSDYLVGDVLPWKRDHRGDDVLSALLEAERDESATRQEVLDQVALLYVAGHETTSGLIGNGVLNLLRHRAELERVQRDPELMPAAIEELNRYDSAIQFTWRYALDPIEVGDQIVEPGEMVLLSLGSANRDATKFGPDADVLDLERASAREALSFGAGMHFCLGAALARREGALAIGSLVTRFPRLALAAPPVRNPRVTFRALHSLHVALAA
jgi:cytochrome P450